MIAIVLSALPGVLRVRVSAQESFQLVLLLSVGLLSLCVVLAVDILLGGLLVGFVLRRYLPDPNQAPVIGNFNAVIATPFWPLVWILAFFLVRGLPQFLLCWKQLPSGRQRFRFSLFVCQSLSIPIAVTQMEVEADLMMSEVSALIIGGSVLAALVYPSLAMAIKPALPSAAS